MTTKILFLGMAAAALAGCQSSAPVSRPGPYVRPGLVMIPADQAHLYRLSPPDCHANDGRSTQTYAPTDVRSVQSEPAVSALQFNRYADPARPNELMHEAHVVYRREGQPRWKLQPSSAQQQILIGPSLTDGRGEIQSLASQELDGYLREQRANIQKQQQVLGQVTEGMKQLSDQQQQLARELAKIRLESSGGVSSENKKSSEPPRDEPPSASDPGTP